jgi:nucleotide-binding universal stress UspA family protein
MIALTNILVATDFSEPSDTALVYGRALAHHFRAVLHVVHVVGNMANAIYGAEAYLVSVPELSQQIVDAARKELDDLIIDSEERPLTIRRVLITSNVPALAIVAYAKQERIGLIVTGTHGRGAVAHALIGSVAERVLRTAPCPVLTVRRPEYEFVVPDNLIVDADAEPRRKE